MYKSEEVGFVFSDRLLVEAGAENSDQSMLLQHYRIPGFALVISMNHTLGDGHELHPSVSLNLR